jgi:hypothetical protein
VENEKTIERIDERCPGCTMSVDLAFGATASSTVFALSAAEMPVVTPVEASIETVNGAP